MDGHPSCTRQMEEAHPLSIQTGCVVMDSVSIFRVPDVGERRQHGSRASNREPSLHCLLFAPSNLDQFLETFHD